MSQKRWWRQARVYVVKKPPRYPSAIIRPKMNFVKILIAIWLLPIPRHWVTCHVVSDTCLDSAYHRLLPSKGRKIVQITDVRLRVTWATIFGDLPQSVAQTPRAPQPAASALEQPPKHRRKYLLWRLGRHLLKDSRCLCCCCCGPNGSFCICSDFKLLFLFFFCISLVFILIVLR